MYRIQVQMKEQSAWVQEKNTMIETGTRAGVKDNKGSRTRQGWLLVAYAGVWTNKTHRIKCQAGLQLGDLQGGSL